MSTAVTFRRSSRVLWRKVGDEVLVADAEGTDVSGLSPPASAAWVLLGRPRRREDLVEELEARFGGSAGEVAEHVDRLLEQFERRGWVTRAAGDG